METYMWLLIAVLLCGVIAQFIIISRYRKFGVEAIKDSEFFSKMNEKTLAIAGIHPWVPHAYFNDKVEVYSFIPAHSNLNTMTFTFFIDFNCGQKYFAGAFEVSVDEIKSTGLKTVELFPLLFSKVDVRLVRRALEQEREC